MFQELQLQRIAAEQRQNALLEEQQRREREAVAAAAAAAAAARRNNERHECNANASPDVKQTLKVTKLFQLFRLLAYNSYTPFLFSPQTFLIQKKIEKEKGQNATWNRNL